MDDLSLFGCLIDRLLFWFKLLFCNWDVEEIVIVGYEFVVECVNVVFSIVFLGFFNVVLKLLEIV